MDWFWQLLDYFQKGAVYAIIRRMSLGDWLMIFAVLWGMAIGAKKGASEMFSKVFVVLLSGVAVLTFYQRVAATFLGVVPDLPLAVAQPIAFVLLTGFALISVGGCANVIGKLIHVEAHGVLKYFGGMLLGAVYLLLLISWIAQFLLFIPSGGLTRSFKEGNTCSGAMVAGFLPRIQEIVTAPFLKNHSKAAKSGKTLTHDAA